MDFAVVIARIYLHETFFAFWSMREPETFTSVDVVNILPIQGSCDTCGRLIRGDWDSAHGGRDTAESDEGLREMHACWRKNVSLDS